MFQNRHVTAGVTKLDAELVESMWRVIDKLEEGADYLQVFKVSPGKVVHISENPPKTTEYKFDTSEESLTIFVIDDKTHSTMLLAEEY